MSKLDDALQKLKEIRRKQAGLDPQSAVAEAEAVLELSEYEEDGSIPRYLINHWAILSVAFVLCMSAALLSFKAASELHRNRLATAVILQRLGEQKDEISSLKKMINKKETVNFTQLELYRNELKSVIAAKDAEAKKLSDDVGDLKTEDQLLLNKIIDLNARIKSVEKKEATQ